MLRFLISVFAMLLLCCTVAVAHERNSLLSEAELVALYGDESDELSAAEAQTLLLMLINTERRTAGLGELQALELASFMARRHAGEMARLGYSSHLDTDGHNPVERYNLLGGTDYVQENLIMLELDWPLLLTERLVRSFHQEWMDSPGHRAAILSPQASQLGCAFELQQIGPQSRMAAVCEFVAEHGDYGRLPQSLAAGDILRCTGQLAGSVQLGWISIGLQDTTGPLGVDVLNALPDSYSLPPETLRLQPASQRSETDPGQGPAYLFETTLAGSGFRLELRIPPEWAGQTAYFYIYGQLPGDPGFRVLACQTTALDS